MKPETPPRVPSSLPQVRLAGRILLAITLALLSLARATEGLTVSVAEFSLSVGAGETTDATFTILNDEPIAAWFRIESTEWDEDEDGVTVLRPDGSVARSCAPWILAGPLEGVLDPFAEVQVRISILVPTEARGTYWSGLRIARNPGGEAIPAQGIVVAGEFLVKLYMTVPLGEIDAEVVGLEVGGFQPLWATLRVYNGGSVRLSGVFGVLSVKDASGAELSAPLPIVDILPGHSIVIRVDTEWRITQPGSYLVRAVVDFGAEYLVAGQVVVRVP